MKLPSPVPLAHWAGFQFQIQLDLPNLLGLKASKLFVCCSSHPPKKCRCQRVDLDLSIPLAAACIQKILIVSAHALPVVPLALGIRSKCRVLGINAITRGPHGYRHTDSTLPVLTDVNQALFVQSLNYLIRTAL
jgi:hypothetical protein